jgi:hypothetical protein
MGAKVSTPEPLPAREWDELEHHTRLNTALNATILTQGQERAFERVSRDNMELNRAAPNHPTPLARGPPMGMPVFPVHSTARPRGWRSR